MELLLLEVKSQDKEDCAMMENANYKNAGKELAVWLEACRVQGQDVFELYQQGLMSKSPEEKIGK